MFNFSKKDYVRIFDNQINDNNLEGAEETVRAAYSDKRVGEDTLAQLAGLVFERKLSDAYDVLEEFVERFPMSLHAIRPMLADFFARIGMYDAATHEAKVHLYIARELDALDGMSNNPIVQAAVSRSFLVATAAYTELGAKSYSRQVLILALGFDLHPIWRPAIENEIERLELEISEEQYIEKDQLWNDFFRSGTNATLLIEDCNNLEYPIMASMVDLMESNFRFNIEYSVSPVDIFNIVIEEGIDESMEAEEKVRCLSVVTAY